MTHGTLPESPKTVGDFSLKGTGMTADRICQFRVKVPIIDSVSSLIHSTGRTVLSEFIVVGISESEGMVQGYIKRGGGRTGRDPHRHPEDVNVA